MTLLLDTTIPRTLDVLLARFAQRPATRVEAWLFEDEAARREAEAVLAGSGTEARLYSAYKPLLHHFLETVAPARPRRVTVRTPAGDFARFRLEAYPLAALLPDTALSFVPGELPLAYEVDLDGQVQRVFVPHRAGAQGGSCGWLRVWEGEALVEDGPLETEFEQAYQAVMAAVGAHAWPAAAPYFGTLQIEVETGGIERRLPWQDECLSTREALHEEFYFAILAGFQQRAGKPDGDRTLQPGQIVPLLRAGSGDTHVRVSVLPLAPAAPEPAPASVPVPAEAAPGGLAAAIAPLTPAQADAAMAALGGEPFLHASTQGRPVRGAYFAGAGPALVVTGGQHANETSGVVGALRAAQALKQRGAHFAVVASENPDGAALHQRLRQDHARHMLHAARYTALGDDLEARQAPPYGEKGARLEAIARTSARLHLSLHGYPAHEWTRPLNGYVPHGFSQWTIPKGFFLILRYHAGLDGTAFLDTLTARLAADPELAAFNAAQLAVWDAHAGELPFAARHGIPCMLMEDHRSTVPFTLVTEFPDQTVYGAAFRLAHTTHMRTVLHAAELLQEGWLS
ncbi:hypothetical protein BKK79_07205 [Cupriavidus sp. USMAA2-4]|uniref:hypothetical protein n=1 Tax=Cupriavidus sp. USMAA2-4 TaxID=876364 RepID=UPI0008A6F5C4|nr:hypothetical protein [Cupriavidus sp. USMAA2-4]AOY91613.1 hypothetical protein BKK79_07205 [Cupriavidus sp. USMAA2-4]